ncbi:Enhancer of split mbeta protein [Eumeta japonica]|uniref:Enhancer of split mbeta protein n=1 Tax=Eumeta variegata TaxID=151549 RepID=A0A4C1UVQ0_EUMVA|nr:Enhancer of split mbeta protein [Eumeta japonica]
MILPARAMSPPSGAFHPPHAPRAIPPAPAHPPPPLHQHPSHDDEPVSRTYQYRKVMKPMLERKRRARINSCLDELKELMVSALQAEGENVAKLEKADILELTVRHLHNLKRRGQLVLKPDTSYAERFRAGFTQCATEVSQFIANATLAANALQRQGPVDPQAGARLLQHLSNCIRRLEAGPGAPPPPGLPRPTPLPALAAGVKRAAGANTEAEAEAEGVVSKRSYAPPSPPHSPASETDPAQPMWRPW